MRKYSDTDEIKIDVVREFTAQQMTLAVSGVGLKQRFENEQS
jgi:hypothetical protein